MKHIVKAEFVDQTTGTRYSPALAGAEPTLFKPHDDDQRDRLIAAGCLSPNAAVDLSTKPIEELTRAELEEVALEGFRSELRNASDDHLRSGVEEYRARQAEADEKDLKKKTVEQLTEIAASEGVDLGGKSKKADIIAAIEAKRQAAA